jgi:hypothetical protein
VKPPGERPRRLRFYRRLTAEQKREYDRSDALGSIPLPPAPALGAAANGVVQALSGGSPAIVARAGQRLLDRICAALEEKTRRPIPPPRLRVLRVRPRSDGGEFHGLYHLSEDGRAEIRLWMFTAAERRIVRPRTFLRTLLHEVCHHLDMCWLGLPSSFHTLGFHARESSLVRALERSGAEIPGGRTRPARTEVERPAGAEPVVRAEDAATPARRRGRAKPPPKQLELF